MTHLPFSWSVEGKKVEHSDREKKWIFMTMMPIGSRRRQLNWPSWRGDASVGIRLFNILTVDGNQSQRHLSVYSDIETDGPVYAEGLPYAGFDVPSFGIDILFVS